MVRRRLAALGLAASGLAALACLPPQIASANDSSASLDAGGLNFVVSAKIAMKEERLFVSKDRIRVHYLFANQSKDDVESLVAFPLPDIANGEAGNYAIESADPVNFIGFEVTVDGKPVTPKVEVKARSLGVDVTALLQKYDLSATTILADDAARQAFSARLRELPQDALAELEKVGAIGRGPGSKDGKGDVNPQWTTSIVFYWMQKFPAGKTIEIAHSYRPAPRVFFTGLDELTSPRMAQRYCPDAAFLAAARAMEKKGGLSGVELRYVLTTGRNWLGPIGHFTLTVDKPDPKTALSTCFKGLEKAGPTSFVARQENFSPVADLGFLMLHTIVGE